MNILKAVTLGFLMLEAANIITLYFFPDSKYANSVGIFKAWDKSKRDPEIHNFVRYLIYWVAGSKLIFVFLLIVLLATADQKQLVLMGAALALSIASFFWRLYPLIRKMDDEDQIQPPHYSKTLGWMIFTFIIIFLGAMIVTVIT